MPMTKYPDDLADFLRANIAGKSAEEMAKLVNEHYGAGTITVKGLQTYKKNHKIRSGYDARFKKGTPSFNKGLKQTEFMSAEAIERTKATRFKKGVKPWNCGVPVGAVRKRANANRVAYLWEKVEQPNKWRLHHQCVWERAHGAIPPGSMVCFINGDTLDCRLENLTLETRAEHAIRNTFGLSYYGEESVEAIKTFVKIKQTKAKLEKRGKKQ